MDQYGIRGISNKWFEFYLKGREQFVSIHGVESDTQNNVSGALQRSILGPLLSILFINDLPNATEFFTLSFADDTTFHISGHDLNFLFEKSNIKLEMTSTWLKANRFTLNIEKTKFMLFS